MITIVEESIVKQINSASDAKRELKDRLLKYAFRKVCDETKQKIIYEILNVPFRYRDVSGRYRSTESIKIDCEFVNCMGSVSAEIYSKNKFTKMLLEEIENAP